jgi:hypothetical protein
MAAKRALRIALIPGDGIGKEVIPVGPSPVPALAAHPLTASPRPAAACSKR